MLPRGLLTDDTQIHLHELREAADFAGEFVHSADCGTANIFESFYLDSNRVERFSDWIRNPDERFGVVFDRNLQFALEFFDGGEDALPLSDKFVYLF